MNKTRIYVAGHTGMVGSAVVRALKSSGGCEIVTRDHSELDLTNQKEVEEFFQDQEIDQVYLSAAKVGGIHANDSYPAEFIYNNLMIECNVIHAASNNNIEKLLFLGSSCIYPRLAPQPMDESCLLTGELEPTNEPYAIAKIAGIKLCESYNRQYGRDYRSVMPTNLYGQNDNFHPQNSHVVPSLMHRFHEAKLTGENEVVVWGTGKPMREFLHVDDMADATVFIMNLEPGVYHADTRPMMSHINIGTGVDCTILELAEIMAEVVGFEGKLVFDTSKPDGTPRKLLDVSRIHQMGWQASIPLREGLSMTYRWYLEHQASLDMATKPE